MQKELDEAGNAGFEFVGVTVSETAFGGKEVVSILRKPKNDWVRILGTHRFQRWHG